MSLCTRFLQWVSQNHDQLAKCNVFLKRMQAWERWKGRDFQNILHSLPAFWQDHNRFGSMFRVLKQWKKVISFEEGTFNSSFLKRSYGGAREKLNPLKSCDRMSRISLATDAGSFRILESISLRVTHRKGLFNESNWFRSQLLALSLQNWATAKRFHDTLFPKRFSNLIPAISHQGTIWAKFFPKQLRGLCANGENRALWGVLAAMGQPTRACSCSSTRVVCKTPFKNQ